MIEKHSEVLYRFFNDFSVKRTSFLNATGIIINVNFII